MQEDKGKGRKEMLSSTFPSFLLFLFLYYALPPFPSSLAPADLVYFSLLARAATLSSTLITSLPSSSVLQSTYLLPPQSILTTLKGQSFPPSQHLPKGMHTLLVDTSTLDVEVFRSVARQMGEQTNGGTGMVDAPFLGGQFRFRRARLRSALCRQS